MGSFNGQHAFRVFNIRIQETIYLFIYLLQNLHNLPLIRNGCTTDIMYRVIHHQSRQEQADSCYLAYCVSAKISSTFRERQNHLASTSQLYSYQQFWLLFGGCGKWDTEKGWGGFTNATVLLSGCKSSFSTGGKRENMKNSSWHQDSLSRHETKTMEKLKHIRKICLCKGKGSRGKGK